MVLLEFQEIWRTDLFGTNSNVTMVTTQMHAFCALNIIKVYAIFLDMNS